MDGLDGAHERQLDDLDLVGLDGILMMWTVDGEGILGLGVGGVARRFVKASHSAPIGRGRDTGHHLKGKRNAMGGRGQRCTYQLLVIDSAGVVWVWVVAGAR